MLNNKNNIQQIKFIPTLRICSLIFILFFVSFWQFCWAETPKAQELYQQRLEHWQKLSPEQKKTILQNYKKYKQLPEKEKIVIQANFQEWQKLTPPEKAELKQKVTKFEKLPSQQKAEIIFEKRLKASPKPKIEFKQLNKKPRFPHKLFKKNLSNKLISRPARNKQLPKQKIRPLKNAGISLKHK